VRAIKNLVVAYTFKGLKTKLYVAIKDFRVEQQFAVGRKREAEEEKIECKR
jgi:hypothetical protein